MLNIQTSFKTSDYSEIRNIKLLSFYCAECASTIVFEDRNCVEQERPSRWMRSIIMNPAKRSVVRSCVSFSLS